MNKRDLEKMMEHPAGRRRLGMMASLEKARPDPVEHDTKKEQEKRLADGDYRYDACRFALKAFRAVNAAITVSGIEILCLDADVTVDVLQHRFNDEHGERPEWDFDVHLAATGRLQRRFVRLPPRPLGR